MAVLSFAFASLTALLLEDGAMVPADKAAGGPAPAAVARVIDGDTFYLEGQPDRIRLFGVDAPEAGRAGWSEARAYLRDLTDAQLVACNTLYIDRYGRPVARCYLTDGRELNRLMLEEPHTQEFCRYSGNAYGSCP